MQYEKKTRSMNFLIELLIVILFFSIACLLCVPLFVKAAQISKNSAKKQLGYHELLSYAETMRGYQGEQLTLYLPGCAVSDNEVICPLKEPVTDWQTIITVEQEETKAGVLYQSTLSLLNEKKEEQAALSVASYAEGNNEERN